MEQKFKTIAIHLPQFHPTPENDAWWGSGFTEWTNVTRAKPLFHGHHQPQVPTDLGFYDLRLAEARLAQEQLAKSYGIDGFCYYHYWFHGQRILHEPIDRKLKNPKEDFPFMLCWANETWSRRWLGEEKEILIEQTYSDEDDLRHIQWLVEVFKDPRYIRIHNRPVFVMYRPTHMPDVSRTLQTFRRVCEEHGLPTPYLIASNSHAANKNLKELGFDDILNFQPKLSALPQAFDDESHWQKWKRNIKHGLWNSKYKIYTYAEAKQLMERSYSYPYLPCSFVGWDNTPRRGDKGIVVCEDSPEIFADYLKRDIEYLLKQQRHPEENLLFINAWNEWAEGNHLEPDLVNGHAYLQALQTVIKSYG